MESDYREIIEKYPVVQLMLNNEQRIEPLLTATDRAVKKCSDKLVRLYREFKGIISDFPKDATTGNVGVNFKEQYVPLDVILDMRTRIHHLPRTELRGLTQLVRSNEYVTRLKMEQYIEVMIYIVIIEELGVIFEESEETILDNYTTSLGEIVEYYGLESEIDRNYAVIGDAVLPNDDRSFEDVLDTMYYGAVGSIVTSTIRSLSTNYPYRTSVEVALQTFQNNHKAHLVLRNNYAFNLAMKNGGERGGVEKFRVVAILDNRTTEFCRHIHGKEFFIWEGEVGVNIPPFHFNCRTFMELLL